MDDLEVGTDVDVAAIVAFLTTLRHARGLSQAELATITGGSQSWLSELESGTILFPRAGSLAKLGRALGVRLGLHVNARGDAVTRQQARVALEVSRELRERGIDVALGRIT